MVESTELTKTELENLQNELSNFKRELDNLENDIIKRRFSDIQGKKNEIEQKMCPTDLEPLKEGIMALYDDIYQECQNKQIDVENTSSNGPASSTPKMAVLSTSNDGGADDGNDGGAGDGNDGGADDNNDGGETDGNAEGEDDGNAEGEDEGNAEGEDEGNDTGTDDSSNTGPEKTGKDNWLKRQLKLMFDKDEWKKNTGTNIARAVSGVWAVSGITWLGTRIFSRPDWEDEIEGYKDMSKKEKRKARRKWRRQRRKKESFRERPLGRFLKWTGIAAAVAGGSYGAQKIVDAIKGDRGATGKDSDKEKLDSYDEQVANNPENKERFETYETFGDKIDILYKNIYDRELKAGYDDKLVMERIAQEQSNGAKHYKGIVPFCLDNQFKNVEGILSQNSSFTTAMYNGLDSMVNFVKNAGTGFLELFVNNYMKFLPSWGIFDRAAGSLSEKLDKWAVENEKAKEEMQYFFRQSIRVQTYLFQKKDQLTKKLVKEAAATHGITEYEIWHDEKNFKKYIEDNPQFQNYLNNPIHLATSVLKQKDIFDDKIDRQLENKIKKIDADRDKILGTVMGEKDILQTINEKKESNEAVDDTEKAKLGEVCNNIIGQMDEMLEVAEDKAFNIYEDLIRKGTWGENASIRDYLENSGLDLLFQSMKTELGEQKQKLLSGELDDEKIKELSNVLNNVLALKKEIEIGSSTIEKDYDENGNIIYRIPGFLHGSMNNLVKGFNLLLDHEWIEGTKYVWSSLLGTGVIITSTGAVMLACQTTRKAGKVIIKNGLRIATMPVWLPSKVVYEGLNHIRPVREFGHKINVFKYFGDNGAATLLDDVINARISLERAERIVSRKRFGWFGHFNSGNTERIRENTFSIVNDMEGDAVGIKQAIFDKIIESQGTHVPYYLTDLKKDRQLYAKLVEQRDYSPDIRRAVMQDRLELKDLKALSQKVSLAHIAEVTKKFNIRIDKTIKKLQELPSAVVQTHVNKLNKLKTSTTLCEDEMESFMKFIDKGFDAKLIPDVAKLLRSRKMIGGKKIGPELRRLLTNGDYAGFKRLLTTNKASLSGIPVDKMIKNFDKILIKRGAIIANGDVLLKRFMRILSKIL